MAITYGMSVKEFWESNPDLFWAYRFSYFNDFKTQQEVYNNNAWLQGAYIYEAVSVALNNSFSKNKLHYSEKPYGSSEESNDESNVMVAKIKNRVLELQSLFKNKSSTTGEKIIT